MNSKLTILIEGGNNTKANSDLADSSRVDGSELSIRMGVVSKTGDIGGPEDISRLGAAGVISMDIITSKSRTPILLNSYLNIAILLRLTLYQL